MFTAQLNSTSLLNRLEVQKNRKHRVREKEKILCRDLCFR